MIEIAIVIGFAIFGINVFLEEFMKVIRNYQTHKSSKAKRQKSDHFYCPYRDTCHVDYAQCLTMYLRSLDYQPGLMYVPQKHSDVQPDKPETPNKPDTLTRPAPVFQEDTAHRW